MASSTLSPTYVADEIADAKTAIAALVLEISDAGKELSKLYTLRGDANADQARVEKDIDYWRKEKTTWEEQKLTYLRRLEQFVTTQREHHGTQVAVHISFDQLILDWYCLI